MLTSAKYGLPELDLVPYPRRYILPLLSTPMSGYGPGFKGLTGI